MKKYRSDISKYGTKIYTHYELGEVLVRLLFVLFVTYKSYKYNN